MRPIVAPEYYEVSIKSEKERIYAAKNISGVCSSQ